LNAKITSGLALLAIGLVIFLWFYSLQGCLTVSECPGRLNAIYFGLLIAIIGAFLCAGGLAEHRRANRLKTMQPED
jgi:hypothetical protein